MSSPCAAHWPRPTPGWRARFYEAFGAARDIALKRLRDVWLGSANWLSLPWLNASMERTRAAMGPDYWPYGFQGTNPEIAAICRYSIDQFLASRLVAPEELFETSLLKT